MDIKNKKNENINNVNYQKPKKLFSMKFFLSFFIILFFISLGIFVGIFISFMQDIPEIADLKSYKPNLTTSIYDDKGELISQLYTEQRTLVKISDIPITLQNAIIAKEDPNFYKHSGFDIRGILRATINNLMHKKVVEGGSTITQQLARNLFLTREKTLSRKIKEIILSLQIEKYYTKQEILELYCNQIYFGHGAYGVEAAARTYFGKNVTELTLPECALLAALPQAPSQIDPYKNPEIALEKRNIVLDRMMIHGYINENEKTQAESTPIILSKFEVKNAPYFVEYVRQQLEATYGNSIYKNGLKVYTTLNTRMQNIAQKLFTLHINNLQKKIESLSGTKLDKKLQGAMIAIDPNTGYIKVMIGGIDFSESEFNRAVQAKRQTGSAFKPIVYAAAIENGFRVSDVLLDSPVVFQNENGTTWKPENFTGKFSGTMIVLNALTHSINVATVKLANQVGLTNIKKYARRLGITSPLGNDYTVALGSSSLSLLELTDAFTAFANGGMLVEPLSIISVRDDSGRTLEQRSVKISEAISPTTAYIMTFMLENVINKGTAKIIRQMGFTGPCAGKTGTTNDHTDAWFIGYTPEIVVGIWIGFDEKEPMGRAMVGGYAAAPLWANFMLNTYYSSNTEFSIPDNIIFKKICTKSGKLATKNCPYTIDAPFVNGTEPTETCMLHTGVQISNFLNEDLQSYDNWDETTEDGEGGEISEIKKQPIKKQQQKDEKEVEGEEEAPESTDTLNF
ncbi:MAG: PBP1A family penicillin-binding protein [Candidatus Goldbacteria bacterium]|nr:PBP1A family penicillin-binding protein [Candidatus Goldiibacteriota bacterium]